MSSGDFMQARARLADKDRSVRDKQRELDEAIHLVRDGDRIAVGGVSPATKPSSSSLAVPPSTS